MADDLLGSVDVIVVFSISFSLYINLFPLNFRRLFCRQGQLTRNKGKKFVNVMNGMSGCNNLHFYRNFLLISSGILTTLFFFYNVYAVFQLVSVCKKGGDIDE